MTETETSAEHLPNGWEADAPIEDTWVRRAAFVIGHEMRSHTGALGGRQIDRPDMIGGLVDRPLSYVNSVVLTQPIGSESLPETMNDWDTEFEFGREATGHVFVFSPFPTPDLTSFGWRLAGHPPVLLRPAAHVDPPTPPGITIERVETIEQLLEWERVAIDVYPLEDLQPAAPRSLVADSMLDDPESERWIARDDRQILGVSSASERFGATLLSFVATVPEARKRGVGTALSWQAALRNLDLPSVTISSDDGRPVYERMGYLPLLRFTLWYRARP